MTDDKNDQLIFWLAVLAAILALSVVAVIVVKFFVWLVLAGLMIYVAWRAIQEIEKREDRDD